MEPSQTTEQVAKQPHPVNQVTTFSKFLALALFVALPFLGGYVGYTYAPTSTEVTLHDTPQRLGDLDLTAGENVLGDECEGKIIDASTENSDYKPAFVPSNKTTPEHIITLCEERIFLFQEDTNTFTRVISQFQENKLGRIFSQENIPADVTEINFDTNGVYINGKRVLDTKSGAYEYFDQGRYIRIFDTIYTITPTEITYYGIYSNIVDYITLEIADPNTFEYLGYSYARDAHAVYYGRKVIALDSNAFILQTLEVPTPDRMDLESLGFGVSEESFDEQSVVHLYGTPLYSIDSTQMYIGPSGRYVADSDTIYFLVRGCFGPPSPILGDLKEKDTYNTNGCN